jgi:maltooligosyltrehalose trehalohydrolase
VLRVWGPAVTRMAVLVGDDPSPHEMTKQPDGYWLGPDLAPDVDYALLLDDDPEPIPDPASRRQPAGVHGRSRTYDQSAYQWRDGVWRGRNLDAAVIYELHVGTFTQQATFDGAIERLDDLAELGVTHVELLPVNAVNGIWNWGYDGVDWYAVHEPYGGPDGLKRFVDAAHARGLAVVLDVVYNHLGPSGNYLPRFGPFLASGRNTWGDYINMAEPGVRRFVIDNALMWLRDFHVDALRLDAVHAIRDESPKHVLAQLSDEVAELSTALGRPLTLIAESDLNDPFILDPTDQGGWGMDAQWDDDVHHALHALLTDERQGYYCDFGSLEVLAKTLRAAFWHDGGYSAFRGRDHGRPIDPARHHGQQFVVCLQNHDQVGNRAAGERLPELTDEGLLRVGAVLLLTSPFTPMLWMGEEWAASTRWPFFTSHPEPELADATGKGRLEEFASYGWDVSQMIDPQDPRAYHDAILKWNERETGVHARTLELYRALLRLRADEPDLRDHDFRRVAVDYDEDEHWLVVHRGAFDVIANVADGPAKLDVRAGSAIVLATGGAELDGQHLMLPAHSAAILRR